MQIILIILRVVFGLAIAGAALTGSPTFASIAIIPGIILFFIDGGWPALAIYGILGFVGVVLLGMLFGW